MSDTIDTTEQIIEDDPIAVRRAKREALMAAGKDPYGHAFAYSPHLADLAEQYADLEDGASTEDEVKVAGRVMAKRDQGKLAFLELRDSTGDMQLFCRINALGEDAFAELKDLDVGDWIGVEGTMMRTKRGQLSVSVASFELLSKSLRPLPEKFHGLADKETRYRQRYVDLVMNREVRDTFEKRFKVVSAIRRSRLLRGGDAHPAPHPRRRERASLRHASQRAGQGLLPAHRHRAASQALAGGRLREGVRDRAPVPQRGHGSVS